MRIAFLTHYTELYGANRSLINLIDGLKDYGVSACCIAPAQGKITQALERRDIPTRTIPFQWWVQNVPEGVGSLRKYYLRLRRAAFNMLFLPRLVRQLKKWRVDIVYTNSSVLPVGALAAKLIRRPHVWHLREFCDLDYGFTFDLGPELTKKIIRRSDALIANSSALGRHFWGEERSETQHVIYNGIASARKFDELRREAHAQEQESEEFTFVLVGVIHPAKGQETAIRALALLLKNIPKARLLIVGSGDTAPLAELAESLGIGDSVEFWGHVDDPFQAYLAADAALMCSRFEAMGRVTVEAMATCRPVIGFDQAGTSELVDHEETGLLYRGGAEELSECMARLADRPQWTKQLGEEAWQRALKRFTIEKYAENIYEVLHSLAQKHLNVGDFE